jgi:hypothetical protein
MVAERSGRTDRSDTRCFADGEPELDQDCGPFSADRGVSVTANRAYNLCGYRVGG